MPYEYIDGKLVRIDQSEKEDHQKTATAKAEEEYIEETSKRETERRAREAYLEDRQAERDYNREVSRMRHPVRTKAVDAIKNAKQNAKNKDYSSHVERAKQLKNNVQLVTKTYKNFKQPKLNTSISKFKDPQLNKKNQQIKKFSPPKKSPSLQMNVPNINSDKFYSKQKRRNRRKTNKRYKKRR